MIEVKEPRSKCLSVSRRNRPSWDIIESYSMEWDIPFAQAVFRIAKEYDQMVRWATYNRGINSHEFK